jgi:transcription initiation factor TFIIB
MRVLYLDASKCPECGSENIGFNEKRAEFFCRDCGFVLMDNIPVVEARHGKAESVLVNPRNKRIAVILNGILRGKFEAKMLLFYAEIKKFSLPKYIEAEVLTLAKRAVELKLTMSYSKLEILSALIYYVCKREAIPVMIKDLEKTYGTRKKRILKSYKMLINELGLKTAGTTLETYMIRIASDLGYNGELATKAISISRKLAIAHPMLKAAVSVWLAAKSLGLKIKKKELAKIAGVSEAALRKNITGQS